MIRRGDRRPFYAPAKYVAELRPSDHESGHQQQQQRRELKSRGGTGGGGSIPWPYNANKNRPGKYSVMKIHLKCSKKVLKLSSYKINLTLLTLSHYCIYIFLYNNRNEAIYQYLRV